MAGIAKEFVTKFENNRWEFDQIVCLNLQFCVNILGITFPRVVKCPFFAQNIQLKRV